MVTRFFIQYSGTAPTSAQLNTFAASIGTAWGTDIKPGCSTGLLLESILCEDLSSPTSAVGNAAIGVNGTRAGAQLPAGVAFVVSYEIARRYRGGHPRGYWPIGTQSDIYTPQQWTAGLVSAMNTDFPAFFTAVQGAGWAAAGTLAQVNVSYYSGFTVYTNPITGRARNRPNLRVTPVQDVVTGYIARANIGSQRRRNKYSP